MRFAAFTGLRAGELGALRIRDVLLMRRGHETVQVRRTVSRVAGGWEVGTPKSERSTRDVPIPPTVADELRAYLEDHPRRADPDAPLWPGRVQGGYGNGKSALDWARPFDVDSV